jgi:hypothetical protein
MADYQNSLLSFNAPLTYNSGAPGWLGPKAPEIHRVSSCSVPPHPLSELFRAIYASRSIN